MLMQSIFSTVLFASAALAAPLSIVKRQEATTALTIQDLIDELASRGYINIDDAQTEVDIEDADETGSPTQISIPNSTSTAITVVTATGTPETAEAPDSESEIEYPVDYPEQYPPPVGGVGGQTVVYIGQRKGKVEHKLEEACTNENVDMVMLSFMHMLKGAGGLPGSDTFAFCSDKLEGTDLSACPDWPAAIKTCQVNGKKVMMSIGGATMEDSFADDEEAKAMAKTVWDIYGGGSSDKRPYGDIKLDGFDLDIENKKPAGWVAFAREMKILFATDSSKQYYLTAAPQCPRPDESLQEAVYEVDYLFIQFYNNPMCAEQNIPESFKAWSEDVRSKNQEAKLFVGVPASKVSASTGYIPTTGLSAIVDQVKSDPAYGGMMTWDFVDALENEEGDFLPALRAAA